MVSRVLWQRVRNGVWFLRWYWESPIVDQILNVMAETDAIVGLVAGILVVITVSVWVVIGWELLRKWVGSKWLENSTFN